MTMKPLITPTVNNNGNAAGDLLQQLINVREALRHAEETMARYSDVTHGRNFQTQKNGEVTAANARHAWHERIAAIKAIREDIGLLAIAIQMQSRDDVVMDEGVEL